MKKFFWIAAFWILILAACGLASLNCSYDPNSYITSAQDIKWSCYNDVFQNAKCYSIVYYQQDVLAVYPDIQYIDGVGMVDYFLSSDGLVNVYFKTTDLYEGYNYTFEVNCGEINGQRTASFSHDMTLTQRDLVSIPYRAIWFKDNAPYVIGFTVIIGFLGLIVYLFLRR